MGLAEDTSGGSGRSSLLSLTLVSIILEISHTGPQV